MKEDRLYTVTRKYYSKLTFYDRSYHDSVEENRWELYGAIQKPVENEVMRVDMVNNMGWAARCDLHEGRFKDYINSEFHTNCLTIANNGGYIRNLKSICINNQDFAISCWFKLNPLYMSRYADHDTENVTLCGWKDSSGKEISIDIFCKDYKNILGNATLRVYYDDRFTEGQYLIPGTIPQNGKWMFFSFQTYNGYNLVHIDGHKIIETLSSGEFSIGTDLIDLKFGAFKKGSSGGIDIDNISVMNDHISYDDYEVFDKPIYDILPENEYVNIDRQQKERVYYKSGKLYGLGFEHYENPSISGNTISFSNSVGNKEIFGLFMNNTYMEPSRYTRSGSSFTIPDLDSTAYYSLVVITQEIDNGFYVDTQKINSTTIPIIPNLMDKNSFLLFDGSLAIVQKDRYQVDSHKIIMNNSGDQLSDNLTLVYLRRKNDGPYKNARFEMNFGRVTGVISDSRSVSFPVIEEFMEFDKSRMVFFLNGTYLPASLYSLNNSSLILNNDADNLVSSDVITAVYLISNEKPTIPWKILNYLNGSSQWDMISDCVDIMRNSNITPDNSLTYTKMKWN